MGKAPIIRIATELVSHRGMVMLLLLVLPIAKDGPLDLELPEWKFLLVVSLLLVSLPRMERALRTSNYQPTLVLVIFSTALTIVAYLLSDVRELSSDMSLVMLTNALFLISLCRIFNSDILRAGIIGITIASLAVCFIAVIQYVVIRYHLTHPMLVGMLMPEQQMGYFEHDIPVGMEGVRVTSVFFHSNQLGHFLAISFGLFFPLLLNAVNAKEKVLYTLIVIAVTSCCILAQSRGGLLLIGLAAVMTLMLYGIQTIKYWKKLFIITLGATAVGAGIFAINATAFLARFASPGLSSREYNWLYTLRLIPDNALFGVGRGVSGYHLTVKYPAIEYVSRLNTFDIKEAFNYSANNPHNYYLATVMEVGVFALVAEILLFGIMVRIGIRLLTQTQRPLIKALAISSVTILVMEFMRGTFEAYIFWGAPETGGVIAFVCAMLLYLDRRREGHGSQYCIAKC